MRVLVFILGLLLQGPAFAQESAVSENVKATVTAEADKKANRVLVKVTPPKGTLLNFDGPWKLKWEGSLPLKGGKESGAESFDKVRSQFALDLNEKGFEQKEKLVGHYNLTYFLCSEDKAWCKREFASGSLALK